RHIPWSLPSEKLFCSRQRFVPLALSEQPPDAEADLPLKCRAAVQRALATGYPWQGSSNRACSRRAGLEPAMVRDYWGGGNHEKTAGADADLLVRQCCGADRAGANRQRQEFRQRYDVRDGLQSQSIQPAQSDQQVEHKAARSDLEHEPEPR